MESAKSIIVKPITSKDARRVIRRLHYSGKVVQNSALHFGVFLNGRIEGAMQFGSSLDKRKMQGLVEGAGWNEFIELNRMAFSDELPRNSESRALSVAFKLIKKHYPHIKWVISFADGAQCGDGTIYRASGFELTGIRKNKTLYEFPTGDVIAGITITANWSLGILKKQADFIGVPHRPRSINEWKKYGVKPLDGFQLRYIYFLDKSAKEKLTVPILPYSKIDEMGAGMYKGLRRVKKANSEDHSERGGAVPTGTLHIV